MVGHAALAFALGAWLAERAGIAARKALLIGVFAGAFAIVPDADMGYAFVGIATAGTTDLSVLQQTFWDAGLTVHRGMTHSLVIGFCSAVGFGLLAARGPSRLLGGGLLGSGVVATTAFVGLLEAGVMVSFVVAGAAVALIASRAGLSSRTVFGVALVGLLTHPFGDLFTGTAPTLLYPFDIRLLPSRVMLSGDPTIHLIGAFAIELATVWLAILVYSRLRGFPVGERIHPGAAAGLVYAGVVLFLPPPTLDVSYHFVYSVLAVSSVGLLTDLPRPDLRRSCSRQTVFLTGLTAATLALVSYSVSYVFVGSTVI